jgi:regulator of extracellular matrix RemA (YlzA/DUF370 family)
MDFSLINIGFGNMAAAGRVMAIISPESAPVKRMVQEARDHCVLIDATYGRKTRSVLIMDSGQIILSAIQPETISHRLVQRENSFGDELEEE